MHTKSLNLLDVNYQLDLKLKLHYGIVEYLAGYDPRKAWQIRGISGRGEASQNYFAYRQEKIEQLRQQLQQDRKLQQRVDDFIAETKELFTALRNDKQGIINSYLDKEFYFILGAARTGGTFMLKELSRGLDFPYRNLHMSILHEHMPDFDIEEPYQIGWRKPENYNYLLFQLAQFLVYIKRQIPNHNYVVKKTRFSKCLQLIDHIFGQKAHYIVTVRHPAAINASRIESKATGAVEDNAKLEAKRTLYLWQSLYQELVRDGLPQGEIIPVQFGPAMDQFLDDFFTEHNSSLTPEQCRITERDYDYDFWTSEFVVNSMEWVKLAWQFHELEFPLPEKIL
ncbi:MAG: hypothetical protein ACQEQI_08765 [Bacillota bacterium]